MYFLGAASIVVRGLGPSCLSLVGHDRACQPGDHGIFWNIWGYHWDNEEYDIN
jgi:hypothetical protein